MCAFIAKTSFFKLHVHLLLGQVRNSLVYFFVICGNWTLLQRPGGPQDPLFCCGFLCMGHVALGHPVAAVGPVFI